MEKATIRLVQPKEARAPKPPTNFWEGLVYSTRYDGRTLFVRFYDAHEKPGQTVYFGAKSEALFLTFFIRPRDHLRVLGRITRQGKCGMSVSIFGLTDEVLAGRKEKAELDARRYVRKMRYMQEGYSELAAERLIQLLGEV